MNILSWHEPLWRELLGNPDGLPHAMILAGPEGLGKFRFAQTLAARLLCEQEGAELDPYQMPCGRCNSCTWLAAGNHPDYRLIHPEEDEVAEEGGGESPSAAVSQRTPSRAGPIRVQQIRALIDFVFMGSHRHGKRIAVLAPAEAMNAAAANAILKVLEEPPPGVYFILVTDVLQRLLPTILSRCRKVLFGYPDADLAKQWLAAEGVSSAPELLQLVGGRPLLAVNWAEQNKLNSYRKAIGVLADNPSDAVAMAAQWGALLKSDEGFDLPELVGAMQKWILDLLLLRTVGELRYHLAWRRQSEILSAQVSAVGLLSCYQDLLRIRAVVGHPLNTQLLLEDLATRYLRLLATGRS